MNVTRSSLNVLNGTARTRRPMTWDKRRPNGLMNKPSRTALRVTIPGLTRLHTLGSAGHREPNSWGVSGKDIDSSQYGVVIPCMSEYAWMDMHRTRRQEASRYGKILVRYRYRGASRLSICRRETTDTDLKSGQWQPTRAKGQNSAGRGRGRGSGGTRTYIRIGLVTLQ